MSHLSVVKNDIIHPAVLDRVYSGKEEHLVNHNDYWQTGPKPRGYNEWVDMYDAGGKITGLWELVQWDPKTGEVRKRVWNKNVITDNGAINILASAIANASNANPWNVIYINNNSGSCQLNGALSTGTPITTGANLPVVSLPADIPLNYPSPANAVVTQLQVGFGQASPQTISMNLATTRNAGNVSLNVVGFTPSSNWANASWVVPLPNVKESPSNANLTGNTTVAGSATQYSGVISSGGFTYTPTTGTGNRLVQVQFTFANSTNGGSTPNGAYTDAWLVNVTSAAGNATTGLFVGNYIAHEINSVMTVNNSNNITVQMAIKI